MAHIRFFRLRELTSRFRDDARGGVILMFTGALLVCTMIAAGAIEMHRRSLATTQIQSAVDSAALAGKQRQVQLRATLPLAAAQAQGALLAKAMFDQIVGESKLFGTPAPSATFTWNADGSLSVATSPTYQTLTGTLMPATFAQLGARATADFANAVPTEVAMVLDTTASMFQKDGRPDTRFLLMRNAAKKFANQLFNAAQANNDANMVRVSVIPWATSVNVRGPAPAAADFTGEAAVVSLPDKGSQIQVPSPLDRSATVNMAAADFAPVTWRGCINGVTEPAAYTDVSVPNFNALIVPAAPKVMMDIAEGPLVATPVTACTCNATANVACGPGDPPTQGFHRLIEKAVPQISSAAFLFDKGAQKQGQPKVDKAQCTTCISETCGTVTQMIPSCSGPAVRQIPYCYYYGANGRRNSYNPAGYACTSQWTGCYETGKGPTASESVPACVADPNEPGSINATVSWCPQYYQAASKDWQTQAEIAGPNLNCPMPMLGLSGNRRQVIEALDRLSPVPGGTHADVGLRWGLRTLSPNHNWPTFFGMTKNPATFGPAAQKVMLMITDGENEQAVNFPGYWGCSEIAGEHGCTGAPDGVELDAKMQSWCDAIRNTYQVTIYAVAVNFGNAGAVNKLRNCAGDPSRVFSVDAADLNTVLSTIASKVMAMRLIN